MPKKKAGSPSDQALHRLFGGKKLTGADRKIVKEAAESVIDGFMKAVGYDDPSERADEHGWRHLQLESAEGVAGITESEGELYLHVEAVVMPLPSDGDLIQPLMREALEFNCKLPGICSLGIRGTRLVASATENLRKLESAEALADCIHTVMALANTIDDEWQKKYAGSTRKRTKSVDLATA